jgi:hypothetical protein
MTRKLIRPFAAAAILGSFFAATTVSAEETTSPSQLPPTQHKTGKHSGMMNMMGQMSGDHMRQMTEMINNCNRLMSTPTGPDTEQAPDHGG